MNDTKKERVFQVVCTAIELFNEQLPPDRRLVPNPACPLVGSPDLDSTELVNLMVMIEQQVERDLGITVSLFDAVGEFINIDTLVRFLAAKNVSGNAQ